MSPPRPISPDFYGNETSEGDPCWERKELIFKSNTYACAVGPRPGSNNLYFTILRNIPQPGGGRERIRTCHVKDQRNSHNGDAWQPPRNSGILGAAMLINQDKKTNSWVITKSVDVRIILPRGEAGQNVIPQHECLK